MTSRKVHSHCRRRISDLRKSCYSPNDYVRDRLVLKLQARNVGNGEGWELRPQYPGGMEGLIAGNANYYLFGVPVLPDPDPLPTDGERVTQWWLASCLLNFTRVMHRI